MKIEIEVPEDMAAEVAQFFASRVQKVVDSLIHVYNQDKSQYFEYGVVYVCSSSMEYDEAFQEAVIAVFAQMNLNCRFLPAPYAGSGSYQLISDA